MQIKDDGTHDILPVGAHFGCTMDHARMPVTWLGQSNGKMRPDGLHAALLQRLHGEPGLAARVKGRVPAHIRGPCRNKERKREWVGGSQLHDRLGLQDKSRKVRAVGLLRCSFNIKMPANLAKTQQDLRLTSSRRSRSAFYTFGSSNRMWSYAAKSVSGSRSTELKGPSAPPRSSQPSGSIQRLSRRQVSGP